MYKILDDFPDYRIYDDGNVWSEKTNKFLVLRKNKFGYFDLGITNKNGKRIRMKVHRLVALAFIPNPNNLPYVNHKDENKENNNVDNLEWCDSKYNNNYGTRSQRQAISCGHKIYCVELNTVYVSISEASRALNIDVGNIQRVCKGERKTAGGYHWRYAED